MSKWTDFRDQVEDALQFDEVTEDMKQNFCQWLVAELLPLAQTAETAAKQVAKDIKEGQPTVPKEAAQKSDRMT